MGKTFKRKEMKYILTKVQKAALLGDIQTYLQADAFANYTICNMYMDTSDKRLIRRSIEKPLYKEKMRIRSYGKVDKSGKVFLELKKKYDGIVYKRRVNMPYDEAMDYIAGMACRNGQIESEIDYFLDYYEALFPFMFISYDRQAFSGKEDPELRVTFDDHIKWRTLDVTLTSDIYGHDLLEDNQCILEIKCAEAMPLWLVRALSKYKIYKISYSKYGQAYRKYQELGGGYNGYIK